MELVGSVVYRQKLVHFNCPCQGGGSGASGLQVLNVCMSCRLCSRLCASLQPQPFRFATGTFKSEESPQSLHMQAVAGMSKVGRGYLRKTNLSQAFLFVNVPHRQQTTLMVCYFCCSMSCNGVSPVA